MASNPPIVTTDDLDAVEAGDADALIEQATAAVRGVCGWHVTPSLTETVTLDPSNGLVLALPSLYVTAVASVTVDGTVLDVADYTWTAAGVLRRVNPSWCWWTSPVTVTFTHGYDSAPDLAEVILTRVSRAKSNPRGATRMQAGPFMEMFSAGVGFTGDELATINRYRIPAST